MNIYGVREANQKGWSKIIKDSDAEGGVIITSNGKPVAMVVSLADANIDIDSVIKDASFNGESNTFLSGHYGHFITIMVGNLLKSLITEFKNKDVRKHIELRNFCSDNIDLVRKIYKDVMNELGIGERPII